MVYVVDRVLGVSVPMGAMDGPVEVVLTWQLPSVWGPVQKGEDPYAPVSDGGCCSCELANQVFTSLLSVLPCRPWKAARAVGVQCFAVMCRATRIAVGFC